MKRLRALFLAPAAVADAGDARGAAGDRCRVQRSDARRLRRRRAAVDPGKLHPACSIRCMRYLSALGVDLACSPRSGASCWDFRWRCSSRDPATRKNLYLALVILPFWTSFLIRLYAWMFLLRDTGLINTVLQSLGLIHEPLPMLYNDGAVILGLVYGYLPFAVLPLYATLERLDPSLLEAAADLGATPCARCWRVTMPLCAPGIWAASILVFVPCLGTYITSDLLGGSKTILIGNLVQNQFTTSRDWPFGAAASMVLMIVAIALLFLMRRSRRGTVMKRGLAVYATCAYLFLHLPLVILAVFSVNASRFTVWQGFSLHWYRAMFADRDLLESAGNSLADRRRVDRARDRHRNAGGLRFVEARFELAGRIALSVAGDARDRHWSFAARVVSMDLSLSASFGSGMHTVILAHVSFSIAYVVRGGDGAVADVRSVRSKKRRWIWARPSSARSGA